MLSVTEDGRTTETGLTIKMLLRNRHVICTTSHPDELAQYRRKLFNYFLNICPFVYPYPPTLGCWVIDVPIPH